MDVVALGELLIDFTFSGTSGQGTGCMKLIQAGRHVMFFLCSRN